MEFSLIVCVFAMFAFLLANLCSCQTILKHTVSMLAFVNISNRIVPKLWHGHFEDHCDYIKIYLDC